MKRHSHTVEKLPGDRMKIFARWTTPMRQPGQVLIQIGASPDTGPVLMIDGETADVFHTFEGLGEIAWEMGWRPKGLSNAVASVVAGYKVPVETA